MSSEPHGPSGDVVLYEERDDIAIITINRPHKKNTLTDAVIQGVADGIDAATKSRDVAAATLFLASEAAEFINGAQLLVDGGLSRVHVMSMGA